MADIHVLRTNPSLADIPAQLRQLADDIEAGTLGDVKSGFAILPVPDDYPRVFGWGSVDGENHPIVQLELAKAFFVHKLSERAV